MRNSFAKKEFRSAAPHQVDANRLGSGYPVEYILTRCPEIGQGDAFQDLDQILCHQDIAPVTVLLLCFDHCFTNSDMSTSEEKCVPSTAYF